MPGGGGTLPQKRVKGHSGGPSLGRGVPWSVGLLLEIR